MHEKESVRLRLPREDASRGVALQPALREQRRISLLAAPIATEAAAAQPPVLASHRIQHAYGTSHGVIHKLKGNIMNAAPPNLAIYGTFLFQTSYFPELQHRPQRLALPSLPSLLLS